MSLFSFDAGQIEVGLIVMWVGGAFTWLFTSVIKLKMDTNAAFTKIRALEAIAGIKKDDDPT